MVISRRSNAAAAKEQPVKSATLGSQFGSEWWQNGAPFRIKLRTVAKCRATGQRRNDRRPARGTIGHRNGSAISKPIPPSPQDQMVGLTCAECKVAYGQPPPDTSSRELSPSASLDVEEIWDTVF